MIDGACLAADYCEFLFKYSLDVRAHYLLHYKRVIGDSAVCCRLSSHICLTPNQS